MSLRFEVGVPHVSPLPRSDSLPFTRFPVTPVHAEDRFDVAFALYGDLRNNSRALRQLRVLGDAGLRIRIVAAGPGEPGAPEIPGASLCAVPISGFSGPRFFLELHRRVREALLETPARLYHASGLYVLPAACSAARKYGGRVVYDARELYTHVSATAGRPWVRAFWYMLERRYIRRADAVLTVGNAIADRLAGTYGVVRPAVLYNIPDRKPPALSPSPLVPDLDPDTVTLLHQGHMMKDRGCEQLVDAMRDIEGAVLVFLGGGPLRPALQKQAADAGIADRIRFVDSVPSDRLPAYTASADLGITLLQDTCLNHRFALPNKLFQYFMAGLPVVASDLPEIRRVVAPHDTGILVEPGNRTALVAALRRAVAQKPLREQWRQSIPRIFETFNPDSVSERLMHIYGELLR